MLRYIAIVLMGLIGMIQLSAQTIDQLTGRVVDVDNGQGIEGVQVQLDNTNEIVYTDSEGKFKFNGNFIKGEPYYSFSLFKEGYISLEEYSKKVVYGSGAVSNLIMTRDFNKFMWITVKDGLSNEFLEGVEVSIRGKTGVTNKMGKISFDFSDFGDKDVIAAFSKDCYKDKQISVRTKGDFSDIELIPDPNCATFENKEQGSKIAEIKIYENFFFWKEVAAYDYNRKALLHIKNFSDVVATDVEIFMYAHYGRKIDTVRFESLKFVFPNDTSLSKGSLNTLPYGILPDSLTICLTNASRGTERKNWSQFVLKKSNFQVYDNSTNYDSKVIRKEYFLNNQPPCIEYKESFEFSTAHDLEDRINYIDEKKAIRKTALSFIVGLNSKNFDLLRKYSTKRLFNHLKTKNNLPTEFGFDVEIINFNENSGYVRLLHTVKGWKDSFMNDFSFFDSTGEIVNSKIRYDFLKEDNSTWIGKLVKKNGQWLFTIHGKSDVKN